MIKADLHVHSNFSPDCKYNMDDQINSAIKRSLKDICFTDHCDLYDKNIIKESRLINYKQDYIDSLLDLKLKYQDKINILIGLEIGLEHNIKQKILDFIDSYEFDFIIGSSHSINNYDIAMDKNYFASKTEKQIFLEYLDCVLKNAREFDIYDVYGHLDYIVRYAPNKDKYFSFDIYKDILEQILKIIINKNKGIEINSAGLRYNLGYPHPNKNILALYKNLGGKIITVGSDSHSPKDIAYEFNTCLEILNNIGFRYYAVFKKHNPEFYKIN